MIRRLLAVSCLAAGLVLAASACDPGPSGGSGGSIGGKPKPRPDTGGTGGPGGTGGGGSGGEGGSGGGPGEMRLDAVRPPRGALQGGDTVRLQGKGFVQDLGKAANGQTQVRFGSNSAIGVRVVDDQTIFAGVPPGAAGGDVDVVVTNPRGEATCTGCFRYLEPLVVDAIAPAEGSPLGGTRVTLRGGVFREGMILVFGDRAALDVRLEDDGSLSATTPPGEGAVDVRVFDEGGQAWLRKAFRYLDLRVDEVDPPGGPLAGGNQVRVKGGELTAGVEVYVEGARVPAVVESAGSLLVTMPARAAPGPVDLELRRGAERAIGGYAYFDPADTSLRLHLVTPASGPVAPEAVTLVGNRLDDARLAVRFGDKLATPVGAATPFFATFLPPAPDAPGLVDVQARAGEEVATLPDAYRYAIPFRLAGVTPSASPLAGGIPITLTGSDFPAAPRIFVGAAEAGSVVRVNATRLTAIVPPGAEGAVPVRVVDAETGASASWQSFRYEGPPRLARVEPISGARAGGTRVTLRGSGFDRSMRVSFGGASATLLDVPDSFTAVVLSPRGDTGLVDVTIEKAGASSTLRDVYSYFNPSSTLGGSSGGPLDGNVNVSVLNAVWWKFGLPVPGATVVVGTEEGSIVGTTDDRGEVTLSSPLLVKPQLVTVTHPDFESATVVNQRSENLTVRLVEMEPGDPPIIGPPPPLPEPGFVQGRVWGFKLPPTRPLRGGEREVAFVSIAAPSVYSLPPFVSESRGIEIPAEGGAFRFSFRSPRQIAIYAVYGVENVHTQEFEPLAMGVTRRVLAQPEVLVETNVILDTHLDVEVPISIVNPPELQGDATSSRVYAYADLAGEGFIPLGSALTTGDRAVFQSLPSLDGVNLVYGLRGGMGLDQAPPYTATFRRQAGDPRQGITIGPLLGLTRFLSPDVGLDSVIEWTRGPGPAPALSYLYLEDADWTPLWHAVVPGSETRVPVPQSLLLQLRRNPSSELRLTLVQGIEPRFEFDQWSYDELTTSAFTSYTVDETVFLP